MSLPDLMLGLHWDTRVSYEGALTSEAELRNLLGRLPELGGSVWVHRGRQLRVDASGWAPGIMLGFLGPRGHHFVTRAGSPRVRESRFMDADTASSVAWALLATGHPPAGWVLEDRVV